MLLFRGQTHERFQYDKDTALKIRQIIPENILVKTKRGKYNLILKLPIFCDYVEKTFQERHFVLVIVKTW